MRWRVLLAAPLAALPAAAAPPVQPPFDVHLDVPQDHGPQHVNVLLREFPVGGSSGWHTHPGTEIAYLVSGTMSLDRQGQPTQRLFPGDAFTVPRGVPHNGANLGKAPARLVITYVVDKDARVRTAVPAPR
jgi:quercetin dioxygenase-like cupin family protein